MRILFDRYIESLHIGPGLTYAEGEYKNAKVRHVLEFGCEKRAKLLYTQECSLVLRLHNPDISHRVIEILLVMSVILCDCDVDLLPIL